MDDIAAFRRAVALLGDKSLRKPADLRDKHLVQMASSDTNPRRKSDRESARDILSESCRRLLDARESNYQPVVALLLALVGDWTPSPNLHRRISMELLAEVLDFVDERVDMLGPEFTTYLTDCINRAKAQHPAARLTEAKLADFEHEYQPDWLGQAFNLTPHKEHGQPTDPERDADILDGMHFIYRALREKSEHYGTKLEEHLQLFIDRKTSELPFCIERLVKLNGYPHAAEYLPSMRTRLARSILDEIERLRGTDHWRGMATANIFVKCQDACVEQVELLLLHSDTSESERELLTERREILRNYGSESLQRNNTGNATGIERLYRKHKDKIHGQIKRSAKLRTLEESESLIAEIDADQANAEARNHPAVREAVKIINSPDVGNQCRVKLLKLEKQTPSKHRWIWPTLWQDFGNALACVVSRMNYSK